MKKTKLPNFCSGSYINVKRFYKAIRYTMKQNKATNIKNYIKSLGINYYRIYFWLTGYHKPDISVFIKYCNKLGLNYQSFLCNNKDFDKKKDIKCKNILAKKGNNDTNFQNYPIVNFTLDFLERLKGKCRSNLLMVHMLSTDYTIISCKLFDTLNSPTLYFHISTLYGSICTYFDRGSWNDISKLKKYNRKNFSTFDKELLKIYLNAIYIEKQKYKII